MPTPADDADAQALAAGIVALLHQLARDLVAVRSTHGGELATLRAEWTATQLSWLVVELARMSTAGPAPSDDPPPPGR